MKDIIKQQVNGTIVEIDFRELAQWVRSTNTRQGKILRVLDRLGIDMENKFHDKIEPLSVTGTLDSSVISEADISTDLSNFKVEVQVNAPYALQALDEGTPPNSGLTGKDLRIWVGRRFGIAGGERNRVAALIANRINMFGSRKFREKKPKLFDEAYKEMISDGILERRLDEIGEIIIA